ncbi:hypothetical protein C8035_v001126 [Colletotrichum spinosum]|uniref:Mitotic apparatus protein p62 n=1 Tax=Colletotrichum spinosum TaxID=1347390 RepID=A0A4R8QG13_9PEZI|nr:hypothetical protein C8035_v001126 [Colletotrichum spinosum]
MASGHVLRIPRTDDGFVIVHVTQTHSKALDVKLVGTDGEAPYAVSLRHDKVSRLVDKNACSEDEWIEILTAVLRQDTVDGIDVDATVKNESTLTLSVRKKAKGFSQRLGTIELAYSPDEVIELLEWCGLAAQTTKEAKEAVAAKTTKIKKLEDGVQQLKDLLDELTERKVEDENQMLEHFCDILNEKKAYIRQLLKTLASVNPSDDLVRGIPGVVKTDRSSQEPDLQNVPAKGKRAAAKSRPSKRKPATEPVEEESSDDGFEAMDVDAARQPAQTESDEDRNTSADEDETASEDEDDEQTAQPARNASSEKSSQSQAKAAEPTAAKEAPPVKRDLPFARKKQAPVKAPTPPPAGSETESDDEL